MEEIDIIELLKRAKEGKAPKKIQLGDDEQILELYNDSDLEYMYFYKDSNEANVYWLERNTITLGTSIKILDKPIIEELDDYSINNLMVNSEEERRIVNCIIGNFNKINEIIRYLNKEEK